MLKMVDGSGIIGVDMVCPLGVSTPQPPNYDRVELEGAGMLVLPNSLDAPLERLELGGKTEQVQTTGKNLFDPNNNYEDLVWIRNDGEIVGGSNARTSDYIPVEQGNYAFQFDIPNPNQMFVAGYNADRAFVKIVGIISRGKCIIKIDNIEIETIRLSYTRESTRIQLERSETQTPYEPYTGGKPAPSPEYPQEIKSVGKWNGEKQKYEIEVVLSGKNLLDITACEAGKVLDSYGNIVNSANGFLTDFIPCFANSPYCRSKKSFTTISFYDRDKNFICCINQYNDGFITPDECRYFRFSINKQDVDYTKAVANVGTALMDYEPYREPKFFILTLNKPLRGIGEMKDELSESGILRRVKSITLNGSEKWYKYENSAFVAMNCYGLKIDDLEVKNYNLTTLCNYLKWAKFPQDVESQSAHGGYIYFTVPKETCLDLESFKEWLAKNTPVLEYRLKEPVLEELSEEDKASIRALKTYYPTTVITADGGELDPDIKVTYRKEI